MSKKDPEVEKKGLSRREFIRDAGLVVGGAAVGTISLTSACNNAANAVTLPPATTTITNPPITVTVTSPPVTQTVQVGLPLTHLIVNGQGYDLQLEPHWTLAKVLRETLGLTGTKNNCDIGECGACTVVVGGKAVLSCLTLAVEAAGQNILTVEGMAKWSGATPTLHPIQQAFIDVDAIQCGTCVPGFVMCAKALLDATPTPTQQQTMEAISGNLCRCSGYWPIVNAIQLAATRIGKGA